MLDIAKLAGQLPGISQHLQKEALASRHRIEQAEIIQQQACIKQQQLIENLDNWRDRLLFAVATPVEPLDSCIDIPAPPYSHSVFASDGSQISPSHHEIVYCYLINVGRVMLHYGQSLHPLLDSLPEVFYQEKDLYISKQWGIRLDEWMGYRRAVSEAEILAEMACQWVLPPGSHTNIPNLAMVDGSLIYWFLYDLPLDAREQILTPILASWEQLKTTKIPFMGYVSASRSVEGINFLRLQSCPYESPNCVVNCSDLEKYPCQKIDPLRDATFWSHRLQPGQRSPLYRSGLKVLELYDESQRIYFCYVHVGSEVARVEIPAWVAEDSTLLNQSLSIMLGQVHKGYGYPVALAESHNQAVVRGSDRARFFALLEQQLVRTGIKNVGISYKEARKRGSVA
ncbi:NurA domain-containing protein [Xenococcus sp. PCC 7305]|uniref:DNA double-strand break repair nuclease NurA n=1 Tax=Xenococcus sp. PCC 7305 TaxID=102125 RepID=UPI0002ACB7FA|nr:DNA double-strand break repair nuclease NurA [Xenococcus sp. PCC 7305]ELS02847.1 NurA domain-containing protein [Xenococcus sp. PCC 7305]